MDLGFDSRHRIAEAPRPSATHAMRTPPPLERVLDTWAGPGCPRLNVRVVLEGLS